VRWRSCIRLFSRVRNPIMREFMNITKALADEKRVRALLAQKFH
jgi:hypothetical protein